MTDKNIDLLISGIIDEEAELIPLLSNEEEESINSEKIPDELAILPLRNTVLFPGVVIPITVGRDKSIKLITEAYKGDKIIGVVSQKNIDDEDPVFDELNKVGTVAHIMKMLRMPDGNTTVIIQGKRRFKLEAMVQSEPYIRATVKDFADSKPVPKDKKFLALVDSLRDLSLQIINASPHIPTEAGFAIKNIESHAFLINFVSSNMNAV